MTRILMAWCERCSDVTQHNRHATLQKMATCASCELEHIIAPNETLLKQIRIINEEINSLNLRKGFLETKRSVVEHQLQPFVIEEKKNVWKHMEVFSPCSRCGHKVRWALDGIPRCRESCAPVGASTTSRKDTFLEDLIAKALAEEIELTKDVEVIHKPGSFVRVDKVQ